MKAMMRPTTFCSSIPVFQMRLRAVCEHRRALAVVALGPQGHGCLMLVLGVPALAVTAVGLGPPLIVKPGPLP